jgi:hypothetical protein
MNQQSSVSDLIVDPASNEASEVVTDAGVDLFDADAAPRGANIARIETDAAPIDTGAAPIGAPTTVTLSEKGRLGDDAQLNSLGLAWEAAITKAFSLEFSIQPRPSRSGTVHSAELPTVFSRCLI